MVVDLVMGALAAMIGIALLVRSASLADHMREGDERWRDHPWISAFEPSDGPLATDTGRWWALRAWVLGSGAGFLAVGSGLLGRALLGL